MTIRDLKPGAIIQMLGEQVYIDAKQTTQVGVRSFLEFKVRRGNQTTALWTSGAIVQGYLDRAQWIENPLPDEA